MSTPFIKAEHIFYGNTETGEIRECKVLEKHTIRGGTEFITDCGNFLATDKESGYFMGINIFGTDKKYIVKTMNDYVWGMSDEALARFEECKR